MLAYHSDFERAVWPISYGLKPGAVFATWRSVFALGSLTKPLGNLYNQTWYLSSPEFDNHVLNMQSFIVKFMPSLQLTWLIKWKCSLFSVSTTYSISYHPKPLMCFSEYPKTFVLGWIYRKRFPFYFSWKKRNKNWTKSSWHLENLLYYNLLSWITFNFDNRYKTYNHPKPLPEFFV